MKTFATIALAAVLGAGSIAAMTTTASADRWHGHHGGGWDNGGAFAAGTILGLGVGALAAQPRYYDEEVPPPRRYIRSSWRAHVDYCLDRFRTYDPETDTYIAADGYPRRCYGTY